MKKVLLLACALFAMTSVWAQKTDLRYNLQVGKEYIQTQNANTLASQDVMGTSTDITTDIKYVLAYKVKSFEGGIYDLDVSYKTIIMESYTPYGSAKYDSEGQGSDTMSKMFRSMKNASFGVKMDVKGDIKEVYGLDAMAERMASEPSFSAQEKALIKEQFESSFGEETFRGNLGAPLAFPKNPVAVGDKWDVNTTASSNGMYMKVNTTYEYTGISDGMWVIKGTSTIFTPSGTQISVEGMDMDIDMKGTMTSEMKYDPATGWVSSGSSKQDVSGTMSMEVPMQGRIDIGMKMTTKIALSGK